MERTTKYRGFGIRVELESVAKDMFDVWFQIEGPTSSNGAKSIGERTKVFAGPYSRRWGYLVAELGGRAAVDVILSLGLLTQQKVAI